MGTEAKPEPAPADAPAQEGEGQDAGPQLNPIESALLAAREKFSAGEPITAADEGAGGEGGDDDSAGAEGGGEGGDAGEGEGEGEGESSAEAQAGEGEGEGEAEGDAGAAAGGDADETIVDEGEGEGEVDQELVVSIPARREGDEDIEIAVDDPNVAERLRQLRNSAVRGEALREAQGKIEKDQADIEEMEAHIQTDPAGFIIANVPAEVIETVAMTLITQGEIWERVQPRLEQLQDPQELRTVRAELKAERLEAEKTLRTRAEGRRASKKTAKLILDGIQRMVPVTDGISDSRRDTIIQSVQGAVAAAVRDKRLTTVDVNDLPLLASTALRLHGIDPLAAAASLKEDGGGESELGKSPAKKKQKTAKQLKSDSDKRKKAAAGTPPGSGAPAAAPKLPAGQTIAERIALAKEKGLGTLMGGK